MALAEKLPTKLTLTIPPHPKHVATLPCEKCVQKLHQSKNSNGKLKNVIMVDDLVLIP